MTDKEILDQIKISQPINGSYVPANSRPPIVAHWSYQYLIEVGGENYLFHIDLPEDTPEDQRDKQARKELKRIVALIAKKVAAW